LAFRYGLLPSEALARADTFDLIVLNTSTLWENHTHSVEQQKESGHSTQKKSAQLSQAELIRMMRAVKGDNYGKDKS